MGLLVKPATYLSVDDFKTQPNDQDLTSYSDLQLENLLVRASAKVDGVLNRSYLPREVTEQFEGDGTNQLFLFNYPIIYVKSAQLVMPGFAPFALPLGDIMVDYARGSVRSWSPMIWRSLGVANVFPRNGLPIVITYAYGFGYPIAPPAFTLGTAVNGSLPSTPINVAVTTRTQAGESLPSIPEVVTPVSGGYSVGILTQPGAYVYRIYSSAGANTDQQIAAAAGSTTFTPVSMTDISVGKYLTLGFGTPSCENVLVTAADATTFTTAPCAFAHGVGDPILAAMTLVAESPATNYGQPVMTVNINSSTAPSIGALPAPLADTSAWDLPWEFVEATRLLALSILWEQNNLANRGIYSVGEGTDKIMFKSTEGMSGKGIPLAESQAADLLSAYSFGGVL